MKTYYYANTIKNITIAFTDLFNDLIVKRLDDSGIVSKTLKVPIKYSPVDKFQQLYKQDESGKRYYVKLPSLAVSLADISYASERATGVNESRYFFDQDLDISTVAEFVEDINPTPYDYSFDLDILTESMDDWCQIIENIIPYFNPSKTLRVKEFSFLNIERDLVVELISISKDFLDPQGEDEKRYVNGTISFKIKGFAYRPVSNVKVIKEIHSKYYVDNNENDSSLLVGQYSTSGFSSTSAMEAVPTSAWSISGDVGEYKYLKKCGPALL